MSNNTRAVVELSRGADPLEAAKVGCLNGATLCNADIYGMGTFGLGMEREQALLSAEDVDGDCILRIAAPDSGRELEVRCSDWLADRIELMDAELKRRRKLARKAADPMRFASREAYGE